MEETILTARIHVLCMTPMMTKGRRYGMRTLYFDQFNEIMSPDSDDISEEEEAKLSDIMENHLEMGHIQLRTIEINGDGWEVHYEDEDTGDYVTETF